MEHMPKPSWPANDPLSDESFRAYPHPPTCTSNSPHRRCHRTGISTACPVGWEWARVGMGVGAGGRRCWPWHGRGACERAPWACGARPSPCHTGHACTHALFTTRPLRATASPTAHGASTTPLAHAHTQFKLTNEQLIKTCTLERQHTPTPPPPHHHHATTSTHTRHTWQRKTYSIHAVKPTHMCPKATLSEATSTSSQHTPRASRTRPCLTHCRRPSPPNDEPRAGCRLRHLVSTYRGGMGAGVGQGMGVRHECESVWECAGLGRCG